MNPGSFPEPLTADAATGDLPEMARLAANYSTSADGYAEFWSPVIRPVARRMLETLPWDGARRVLDVGTGTGALLPDIQAFAPTAHVVGIDRSAGMLALAARDGVRLALMDAPRLGLRPGAFDVAVMTFVLFHLPDPAAALAELRRVLRPDGGVGVATWAEDPLPAAGTMWDATLDEWGAWDPSPPPARRDNLMDTPEKLAALLVIAGLRPRRVWIEPVEHQWDAARYFGLRTRFGTSKRKLESLDAPKREAFLDRMRERLRELAPPDFLYRAAAVCAVAAR
ncbi:MAG: methyltransferase domain-containing protein [Candidatus Rokubacteria bacterium]|nr:methyltransferase domain-containing protein [Candidatus Rokubacteria bacterium]